MLIGSSQYQSPDLPALSSARHNMLDLEVALTDSTRGGVFNREHCYPFSGQEDRRALRGELDRIASEATDTFLFYFAGHGLPGVESTGLHLALYHSDQKYPELNSLSLQDVSKIFKLSPALRKVLILDCCFSSRALASVDLSSLHGQRVTGQFTLASAPVNEVAYAPEGKRNTQFTGELLEILRSGIPSGPEFMTLRDVTTHLIDIMRQKGLPVPTPLSLGTPDELVIAHNPLCRGTGGTVAEPHSGAVEWDEFQSLLVHCAELPATLVFSLYQEIIGERGPELDPDRDTTFSVLNRLNQLAHPAHELPRVLKFAIMAAHETADPATVTALTAWTDQVAARLGLPRVVDAVRAKVARDSDREPLNVYLVVRIVRDLRGGKTKRYRATVTLHRGNRRSPQRFDEDQLWSITELRRQLPELIRGYIRNAGAAKDRATIEFVVPRELLNSAFDEWRLPNSDTTLGYWYRVVVCDLEREDRDVPNPDWQRKWNRLQNQAGLPDADDILWWICPTESRDLRAFRLALVNNRRWLCIALEAAPNPHHRRLMNLGLDLGAPAAIWPRRTTVEPSAIREMLSDTALARLPDRVREVRRAAGADAEHIGRGLTLLWDDPTRSQPLNSPLVEPAQGGPVG